jgi:hypothetical protein
VPTSDQLADIFTKALGIKQVWRNEIKTWSGENY